MSDQMEADLGSQRRDQMSVAQENSAAPTTAQSATLEQRWNVRSQRLVNRGEAPGASAQDVRIGAWNRPGLVVPDSMAEGLSNPFSGQGHRDAQQEAMHGGRPGNGAGPSSNSRSAGFNNGAGPNSGAGPSSGAGSSSRGLNTHRPHQAAPSIPATPAATATPQPGLESTTQPTVQATPTASSSVTAASPVPTHAHAADPYFLDIKCKKMAAHFAVNPGERSDRYYAMFPEQIPYLEEAFKKLADDEADNAAEEEVAQEKSAQELAAEEEAANEKGIMEAEAKLEADAEKHAEEEAEKATKEKVEGQKGKALVRPMPGKVTVRFIDSEGTYLGPRTKVFPLEARLHANLNVTLMEGAPDVSVQDKAAYEAAKAFEAALK